jgi:hypothetical protein
MWEEAMKALSEVGLLYDIFLELLGKIVGDLRITSKYD